MKVPYTKNIYNLFQGPPNPGFRSVKVQTETFLKKDSRDFNFFFIQGSYKSLASLKAKLEGALFLGIQDCKKQCETLSHIVL